MPDKETQSHRESSGLQKRKRPENAGRPSPAPRPLLNEAAKAEATELQCRAAAEALVLLQRIVVAESARKASQTKASQTRRAERQNPFEAWYLRVSEHEKVRRESKRQETAFGLAVGTAVLMLLAYLWGMWLAFDRFASGWELLPILFGSLIAFSVLFYKALGRRGKKS